jgi:hypothetical protein
MVALTQRQAVVLDVIIVETCMYGEQAMNPLYEEAI